ncbi:hypothetical protein DL93DRAFT_2060627 [Clavulina sp. PMI_390]|nr:hypothetical protein DL93DRAFT_2060627 [Clavulina sp. PMI_390]
MDFLDDSSDTESNTSLHQLTINEHYAKAFEYKKEREELAKLKEKYGSDYEDENNGEDDSESETEDEDGEELTPAVDAAILRTLARIQKKDPAIYDAAQGVFQEEQARTSSSTPWGYQATKDRKDKSKPLTIQQQNMQSLLHGSRSPSPGPTRPTHVEEQRVLRDETISAFHNAVSADSDADSDDDGLEGGLLSLREKTKDELERQEEEYKAYLEREVGDVKSLIQLDEPPRDSDGNLLVDVRRTDEAGPSTSTKKSKKRKARKEETDQEFLLNYIFNRGWIDRESRHLPTYTDVTGRQSGSISKKEEAEAAEDEVPDVDELEEFDELADVFESTYNFRFEEPGAATIQSHPRNINSTVRRDDNPRREARERRKARKEEEIAKKNEEVKRLKALKMREIRKKLGVIGREGGLAEDGISELQELDLDGEWDAEKHDAQMATLYDMEGEMPEEDDDGKPIWNDDIDISDLVPPEEKKKSKKQQKKEERKKAKAAALAAANDDDGVDVDAMDADAPALELGDDEEWDGTEEMRKRKLDEYMDELYGLEFNDITAGIPTRFKYAPVDKTAYQLTPVEILLATDGELNDYVSLKKLAPYRKGKNRDGAWDPKRGEKLKDFRQKIHDRTGTSHWAGPTPSAHAATNGDGEAKKKRKGKKERQRAKAAEGTEFVGDATINENGKRSRVQGAEDGLPPEEQEVGERSHKKRKRKKHSTED